ncbi:MAG: HAD-IB family phosphatase [Proteobacteria bacterium]|nr:HAD-IB family phosphatase [Pseudomonadota bacterium]
MLFIIDFDGTLSVRDTVDTLLAKFAAPEWEDIEQQWLAGEISAVECMQRQIGLVKADHVTLESFFRGIQLDASFLPFHLHVSAFADIAIVSDGLDHAINISMRHAVFPQLPVYANHLNFVPDGISISFPYLNQDCTDGNGVCKCAVARDLVQECGGPVVLIGDGKSDACLARHAEVVFAKGSLVDYCEQQGIAYHPFQSFADVLARVKKWPREGPPGAAALLA